jgi:membrane-associated protein
VLESLLDVLAASPWAYGVLFLLVLLDVLFPPAPGEIALVTSGVLAASGDLSIVLVLLAATAGAIAGDHVAYAIGRSLRGYRRGRLFRRAQSRLPQAEAELAARSVSAIVLGRFIPFGRTAVTLASGILRLPWSRFVALDGFAALVWATQGALLGYFGGRTFENPVLAVFVGVALALATTGAIEVVRRRRGRTRSPDCQDSPVGPLAAPACTSPDS